MLENIFRAPVGDARTSRQGYSFWATYRSRKPLPVSRLIARTHACHSTEDRCGWLPSSDFTTTHPLPAVGSHVEGLSLLEHASRRLPLAFLPHYNSCCCAHTYTRLRVGLPAFYVLLPIAAPFRARLNLFRSARRQCLSLCEQRLITGSQRSAHKVAHTSNGGVSFREWGGQLARQPERGHTRRCDAGSV